MNMKVLMVVIVLIVLVVGGVFVLGRKQNTQMSTSEQSTTNSQPTQETASKNAVTIQNFAFSPATITVKAGESVTWTNQDSVGHSATADDKSFDTGVLSQGASKSVTFSKPGTYTYFCSVHPNMKATVIVQ